MRTKSCPVSIKAAGEPDGLPAGQFEAIVSVFDNVDAYGDVVIPGAFKNTLEEWKASGNPIPIYYSHRMDDPDFNIGHVVDAAELLAGDERLPADLKELGGLWIKGELDVETPIPGSKAPQVHRLLKGRRVTQFSFAYDVIELAEAKRDGEDVLELIELKLYEVGPTPIGANQATDLLAVKSLAEATVRDVKAGRTLSAKNEDLVRSAHQALGSVLEALEDQDKSEASARPAKSEESGSAAEKAGQPGTKLEEPSVVSAEHLLMEVQAWETS